MKRIILGISVFLLLILIIVSDIKDLNGILKTPIDGLISRIDKSDADYRPILVTGGRLVDQKIREKLIASQLNVPHEYLIKRGEITEQGSMTRSLVVEVMLPNFVSGKLWQITKEKELAERFPDEYQKRKTLKKKDMSSELKKAYEEITEEYASKRIAISLSAARDIYANKFGWEGPPRNEELQKLADNGEYFGPIPTFKGRLQNSPGLLTVKKVGKYGEGTWPYRDGLGRDFVKQESNPAYPLWEYGHYTPVGSRNPTRFYYVPVEPEEPHQIYIECGWNGNIDYLNHSNCKAESLFDETISYSFSFSRTRLNEYHDLNQKVVGLIRSFVREKASFKELKE